MESGYEINSIEQINQITAKFLRQHFLFLEESCHNPGGRHAVFRTLRAFLNWYEDEAEPEGWGNPIHKVKAPKVPVEPLEPVSYETIAGMIKTCDRGTFTGDRDAALAAFAKDILHIDVELIDSDNPNWGGACSYDPGGRPARIVVAGNRSPLFRAQTLAHELAHALLHSDKDYRAHTPRSRIECEAESVSFCIMHHFGLDVGEVSFGYLAHWGDGENALTELLECGERIRDAAHQVITWVDEEYDADAAVEGAGKPIIMAETELVPA